MLPPCRDKNSLRLRSRAFEMARYPCADIQGSYVGDGRGTVCNVCQVPIVDPEMEFEVNLKPVNIDNPKRLQFHLNCYEAWCEACRQWRNLSVQEEQIART